MKDEQEEMEKIHIVNYEIYSETLLKLNMKGPMT